MRRENDRKTRWTRAARYTVAAGALGAMTIGAQGPNTNGPAASPGCPGVQITLPVSGPGVEQYLTQHPPVQFPGGPGEPQQNPPQPPPFDELDVDGDGLLNYDEALAIPNMDEQRFMELDVSNDGYLSEDELPPPGPPPFDQLDLDGDGLLNYDEALAIPNMDEQHFNQLDQDGDGYLSEDEMPPPPPGPGGPPNGGPRPQGQPRP